MARPVVDAQPARLYDGGMLTRIGVGALVVGLLVVACSGVDLEAKDQPKKDKDASVPKNNCGDARSACSKNEQCCSNICFTESGECGCRFSGQLCQSSAECCNGLPCTADSTGVFRCAVLCRANGDTCTGSQDCCDLTPCSPDATGTFRCGAVSP